MPRRLLLMLLPALLPAAVRADEPVPFEAKAALVTPVADGQAEIRVVIKPTLDDLRVNALPSPRLRLAPDQRGLKLIEPRRRAKEPSAFELRYVEPDHPFRFPVRLEASAPTGSHRVEGTISFVYCSTSQGWCRKGARRVEIPVEIR